MSSTNLTPIDILRRRKTRLQVKSDALTDILEENFVYLQNNAVSLLTERAVDAFIAKMPPFVQVLFRKESKEEESSSPFKFMGLATGALDLLPLFLKGGKGIVASFLIRQLRKFFIRTK